MGPGRPTAGSVPHNHSPLQKRLTNLYPDRRSEEYEAMEVLSTKLHMLRSFEPPSATALAAHHTQTDNEVEDEVQEESDDIDNELCSLFPFTVDFMDFSRYSAFAHATAASDPPRILLPH